jgi:hypothetical protein
MFLANLAACFYLQMPSDKFWESLPNYKAPQLFAALFIIVILLLFWWMRYATAPGTARLAAEREDRKDAISILERQTARLESQLLELQSKIARLEEQSTYDRDYRHTLANQNQTLILSLDTMTTLLGDLLRAHPPLDPHYEATFAAIPRASQILANNPLPDRRDYRLRPVGAGTAAPLGQMP